MKSTTLARLGFSVTFTGMALLAVAGCGARDGLLEIDGTGGAPGGTIVGTSGVAGTTISATVTGFGRGASHLRKVCAPNDGYALELTIERSPSCPAAAPGLRFLVWGADLASLHDGVTLKVFSDGNATTQGSRWIFEGPSTSMSVPVTTGVLVFVTFTDGVAAVGTYKVTFNDGSSEQGAFSAVWCSDSPQCG